MRTAKRLAAIGVLIGLANPGPALAQDGATSSREAALTRLFDEGPVDEAWFARGFLDAVPTAQIDAILRSLTSEFGELEAIELDGATGVVRLAGAEIGVSIQLDDQGRITGLFFQPPVLRETDPKAIAARIMDAAVGDASLLATVGGEDIVAVKAESPFAVGSAFKLYVLRAYEDAVADGRLRRDDVVTLTDADRSLPSGVLQNAPPGLPITLEALATLMIQISDNTATDALMRAVGRVEIEALSPRNVPFLTTVEAFKLKAEEARSLYARFVAGEVDERRAILDEIAASDLAAPGDLRGDASWEVEWFATARELCDLIASLGDAPAMTLPDTAPLKAEDWSSAAYKGGSEFGVLNLTAFARRADGTPVCVVLSANGYESQPNERLATVFSGLVGALR